MIKHLTETQKSKLSAYRDKWIAIGLETKPADRKEAERGIEEVYKVTGLAKPKVIWCLSPFSSGLTRFCVLKIVKAKLSKASVGASVVASVRASVVASVVDSVRDSVRASVVASVVDSVRDSVGASVGDSVVDSVADSVGDSVRASVRASVRDSVVDSVGASVVASVRDSVLDSVRDSVWDSVRDSVRDSVVDSVGDSVRASGYGQHDASWLSFYDYFKNELKLEAQTEKLRGLWIVAQNANWFIPHEKICWISERHDICKVKDGRIHAENGPAIHYPDGFSIWALNGVRVPQWLVETGADRIDPKKFMEIDNAEVRREFVRKVGMEMIIQRCGATTLDKKGDYELLRFKISESEGEEWTYLKMRNPSIDIWHVEGVPNKIRTVDEALRWREPKELQGITRSENGRDYYQQGDVVIWPREARVLKPQPTIVT